MTIRVVKVNNLRTPEQRAGVCYIGRAFAGWPASLWGNPFKVDSSRNWGIRTCLEKFTKHADMMPHSWLMNLWEACEQGAKPLGCWCIDATHGDGQPVVCHGQILAAMLHERFVEAAR